MTNQGPCTKKSMLRAQIVASEGERILVLSPGKKAPLQSHGKGKGIVITCYDMPIGADELERYIQEKVGRNHDAKENEAGPIQHSDGTGHLGE